MPIVPQQGVGLHAHLPPPCQDFPLPVLDQVLCLLSQLLWVHICKHFHCGYQLSLAVAIVIFSLSLSWSLGRMDMTQMSYLGLNWVLCVFLAYTAKRSLPYKGWDIQWSIGRAMPVIRNLFIYKSTSSHNSNSLLLLCPYLATGS